MGAHSFPRAARLTKAAEFAALRGGQRISCRHFHAEFRPNTLTTGRLGLVVSKRVSKRAVDRNRLKRLSRDSFRRWCERLPCVDLVLIPRASAVPIAGRDLLRDLDTLWQRLAALKPSAEAGTMRAANP
jgi:ribonuclease P protein component